MELRSLDPNWVSQVEIHRFTKRSVDSFYHNDTIDEMPAIYYGRVLEYWTSYGSHGRPTGLSAYSSMGPIDWIHWISKVGVHQEFNSRPWQNLMDSPSRISNRIFCPLYYMMFLRESTHLSAKQLQYMYLIFGWPLLYLVIILFSHFVIAQI